MNRTNARATLLWAVASVLLAVSTVRSDTPDLVVVYPKPGQIVTAVDSIFGHVTGQIDVRKHRLTINGADVPIHRDGGFLAFLPVTPGDFVFALELFRREGGGSGRAETAMPVAAASVPVSIPRPLKTLPGGVLQITGDYRAPRGDLVLTAGTRLVVMFRGSPDMRAWFSIPGVVDSVPAAEMEPLEQPYWGEAVFGAGAVPESVMIGGVYSGFYDVLSTVSAGSVPVIYHLAPPDPARIVAKVVAAPADPRVPQWLAQLYPQGPVSQESAYRVSLNPPDYPCAIRFTDSVQIIRHAPGKGYFSIFQPEGVVAMAVGAEADWYRVKLSATQYGWVNQRSAERLAEGILPSRSYLASVRTYSHDDHVLLEFPLAGRHPYRIIEDDRRTIRIQLFGVTTNTDWIRYDFSDRLVEIATWSQPEPGLYEFRVSLTGDMWGYDAYYAGNTFFFKLRRPPADLKRIRGKRIVIDPGHSADPGAIGPTGLTEAEANLNIALVLAHQLRKKGAEVILTRADDSDLALYDRPAIAKLNDADLFISIHNNALPDGVNPFTNNGVSSYYYHPHSIELARAIQEEMIKATGLPDFGLYHGNLAVNRPTQYPAVLIECAFMMIPEQEALLKTEKFHRKVSGAIIKGIEKFLKGYDDGRK